MLKIMHRRLGYTGYLSYIYHVGDDSNAKIKVMFKTDAVIDLWVGINGGFITVDEYYEMLNLLN